MKRLTALLLAMVMVIGIVIPSTNVSAATTKVKDLYTNKTSSVTTLPKKYLYVEGKKIDMKNIPIFVRSGNYMGGVAKIFKNSDLNVKLEDYKEKGVAYIKLTYRGKVLVMSQGTNAATLNGKSVKMAAVPFRAYYTTSKATRWVVPISSVCAKLGINYTRSSDGVIKITAPKETPAKEPSTTATTEEPSKPTEPAVDNTPTNSSTDKPSTGSKPTSSKKRIVLVLDAGHGGSDSGALGNGLKEKNLTLGIVLAAKKHFDGNSRFQVYYSRTADTYPSLSARSDLANKHSADLFISVHINSYTSASSKGTETLYNSSRVSVTKKNNITSKVLADYMQKSALKATGFTNRGLINRTGLSVLNRTKMPACLIEYGFITNPKEAVSMKNGTSRYGLALYNAVVQLCKDRGLY